MKKQKTKPLKSSTTLSNSLGGLTNNLFPSPYPGNGAPVGHSDTLYYNLRWYIISNQRNLLAEMYGEWGLVQTLIDQPVDDGFRAGWQTKTGQLSPEQIEQMEHYMEKYRVVETIKYALKWARLFGGGAIILLTAQDPATPLDASKLTPDSPLEFIDADMWELYGNMQYQEQTATILPDREFYTYYGHKIHSSRVFIVKGKRAPSPLRPKLLGWGMSELEKVVRSMNQYLKNQDVVFELLDEAKIDVYKMEGFNSSLLTSEGTNQISNRVQQSNIIKNFLNAITMDKDDEYEQKQMSFAGLPDMLKEIRIGVACDLKIPVTKLFGTSVGGLGSGEDEIENYNAMIESEIRGKSKYIVIQILEIVAQKLFGVKPVDLMINFNPLRILSAEEEETVKEKQFNRVMMAYQQGLIPAQEAKEAINKASLLPVEIDESLEGLEPISSAFTPDQDEA